jgi:hypothetical protein
VTQSNTPIVRLRARHEFDCRGRSQVLGDRQRKRQRFGGNSNATVFIDDVFHDTTPVAAADVNNDGSVDGTDLSRWRQSWGQTPASNKNLGFSCCRRRTVRRSDRVAGGHFRPMLRSLAGASGLRLIVLLTHLSKITINGLIDSTWPVDENLLH